MYKTIIVPIDLGHAAKGKAMLDIAGQLLDKGGRIILVNVIEEVPTFVAAQLPTGILEQSTKNAATDLGDIAGAAGLHAEIDVRVGRPATAINAIAEEKGAELIIVASHRPGLQDYLLGSTAASVVRHAKCSVLVAR